MKQKFILIVLALSVLTSCSNNDDNDSPSCIEPPSGTVEPDKTNLTVFFDEGLESFVRIQLVDSNNDMFDLDVSSFSQKPFSEWQVIPDLNFDTIILETITDMYYEYENVDFVDSSELVLVITRTSEDFAVSIDAYIPCNDTTIN